MYKRERNLYKYLHKKKNQNKCLLLKTTWKEEDIQLFKKIPPVIRLRCGRSNKTTLWETLQGHMHQHYISWLISVLTPLPNSQATPQRCQGFHTYMASNRTQACRDTHSHLLRSKLTHIHTSPQQTAYHHDYKPKVKIENPLSTWIWASRWWH